MRPIDADKLHDVLCEHIKHNEEQGFSATEARLLLHMVDYTPPIETFYDYNLEHLAFVAALLQNKGVTEENLADVINCVDWVVGLVLDNMKERVIQSVIGQSKPTEAVKETDEVEE